MTSSTVRQRELGKRLRDLRLQQARTVEDVAEKLMCSATKISRLETGARRPSLRDVRDLCAIYEVDESASVELMNLARRAREQGWWSQYDDLGLDPLIGLEEDASAITCYSMYYMPALLQTADYARAIIKTIARKIDPKILEQRVEARLRRQQLLEKATPPRYRVLLDEAALKRHAGEPTFMVAQLDKVLETVHQDKVAVQIIPFDFGAHAAADSYFVLLEFDDPNLAPVVYLEGLTGNQYLERKVDVSRYREAVEYLRDSALSPKDSLQRIAEYRQSYASG
jgi:transcriptional regulator with XRE-family HTH domain